jgi:hypothetical protein
VAAPDYVPAFTTRPARTYASPPRRPGEWTADRPADLGAPQPEGPGLGWQGPDQGYVLKLVHLFDGRLVLADGEHAEDAEAGCVAVALRRASMFGRAPVVHDLTMAFSVWGFLSPAPADLVALRRPLFEGIAHPHHHAGRHRIGELVPAEVLRLGHDEAARRAAADWRSVLDVDAASLPTSH